MSTRSIMNIPSSNKTIYLIETVDAIGKPFKEASIKRDLDSIKDTIIHTAPEIINKRWMDIYLYCSKHFNDSENLNHFRALNTYNERYENYKNIYKH